MIKTIALALASVMLCSAMADAATCLSSAAQVRKQQPHQWPKWTYGPNGERCWYGGKKPVFAKAARAPREARARRYPQGPHAEPAAPVAIETDVRTDSVPRPWDLEYRWTIRGP